MAVEVEVDEVIGRCTIRVSDVITVEDVKAGIQLQFTSGGRRMPTLIDTTAATGVNIRFADMPVLLGFVRQRLESRGARGPIAVLAPQDATYGVARMYTLTVETELPMRIHAVRTLAEAEAWLAQEVPATI